MNYKQTIGFLYSQLPVYHRIGQAAYKADLNNTIALNTYFGHPDKKFLTVHIAGTNGKGSVSHMVASILQEAGYKTGLYTSPHLKDLRERIKVNGRKITQKEVISFVRNHKGIIDSIKPSFFEMVVSMAFDYFARMEVDVAVIEVGLGGRLDSTNIISPVLSVVTNIGHDHMNLLGQTLGKVATEKAGIIKRNVSVVIGETQKETRRVFVEKAAELSSKIVFADDWYDCILGDPDIKSGIRKYRIIDKRTGNVIEGKTDLGGDYQEKNLPTVFCALDILQGHFKISNENRSDGIRKVVTKTGLKGRWQILNNNPLIICDTGHNKEGLEYVIRQIGSMKKSKLHCVIGFVNDKNLSSVLPLFPKDAIYYFTKASIPRALDEKKLMSDALKYDLKGVSYPSVCQALAAAKSNAEINDMIFIGGSTFVVAEVI